MSFVSGVTDTLITARCVHTRRVIRTLAVIFLTLVYICTTQRIIDTFTPNTCL